MNTRNKAPLYQPGVLSQDAGVIISLIASVFCLFGDHALKLFDLAVANAVLIRRKISDYRSTAMPILGLYSHIAEGLFNEDEVYDYFVGASIISVFSREKTNLTGSLYYDIGKFFAWWLPDEYLSSVANKADTAESGPFLDKLKNLFFSAKNAFFNATPPSDPDREFEISEFGSQLAYALRRFGAAKISARFQNWLADRFNVAAEQGDINEIYETLAVLAPYSSREMNEAGGILGDLVKKAAGYVLPILGGAVAGPAGAVAGQAVASSFNPKGYGGAPVPSHTPVNYPNANTQGSGASSPNMQAVYDLLNSIKGAASNTAQTVFDNVVGGSGGDCDCNRQQNQNPSASNRPSQSSGQSSGSGYDPNMVVF